MLAKKIGKWGEGAAGHTHEPPFVRRPINLCSLRARHEVRSHHAANDQLVDITQLILDDHHDQRRYFAMLEQIDATDVASLGSVWGRLATALEVHAKAEEELFYPELLKSGHGAGDKPDAKSETKDAIKDHNEIRDAIAEVAKHQIGTPAWFDAVDKANEANSDHMGEEEREGLTDFRRNVSLELRHELAVKFVTFEARHIDGVTPENPRPSDYIREHSE